MDWRALLHNRWVWVGGAGAAGLGALALWRRRNSAGGSAGGTVSGDTAGYQPGGVGYFDSTGTDVAAQLSQYGQAFEQELADATAAWQTSFDQFTEQVNSQIANIPTEQAPTGVPPAPRPTTPPPPEKTTRQTTTITVREGNHVDPVLASIHAYLPDFTLADLKVLNPNILINQANQNGYISALNPDRGGSIPVFNVGTSAQVKIPAR